MNNKFPFFPSNPGTPGNVPNIPGNPAIDPNGVPWANPGGIPGAQPLGGRTPGMPWARPSPYHPGARSEDRKVEDHPLYKRVQERLESIGHARRQATANPKRTHMIFVLDNSTSMYKGKEITIGGYNDQVRIVREHQADAGEATVSLVLFDTVVKTVYAFAPVAALEPLSDRTYLPSGWTALYDGIGQALDLVLQADGFEQSNTAFFVAVFTDGDENQSKSCYGALIAKCIALLEATGRVTFSFMGPREGLQSIGDVLAIAPGNMAGYDADTVVGRTAAFASMSNATANYMSLRSAGMTTTTNLYNEDKIPKS